MSALEIAVLGFYVIVGSAMAVGCARTYHKHYGEWPHGFLLAGTVIFWPFLVIDAALRR